MTICTSCREDLPGFSFNRDRYRPSGLTARCKQCLKAAREPKRDALNAKQRARYRQDPQAKIEKTRAYHLANPEWSKERLRASHEKHRDVRYERVKQRLQTDPEFVEYRRAQTRASESKRRALKAGSTTEPVTAALLDLLLAEWGSACWICAHNVGEGGAPLHWDHYQPLSAGGPHSLLNLRPSCEACNVRKSAQWPFTELDRAKVASEVQALRGQTVQEVIA